MMFLSCNRLIMSGLNSAVFFKTIWGKCGENMVKVGKTTKKTAKNREK